MGLVTVVMELASPDVDGDGVAVAVVTVVMI